MRFGSLPTRSTAFLTICLSALIGVISTPAAAQSNDDVIVAVPSFGVGNRSRAGDWAGIQVSLADQGTQVREVIVWIEIKDSDGDFAHHHQVVATAPGEVKTVWLYVKLPPGIASMGGGFPVFVHEASTDSSGNVQIGKRLGSTVATVRNVVNEVVAMTAIIGRSHAGLLGYTPSQQNQKLFQMGGHERMVLVAGIEFSNLPDRWIGLMQFDTIVWTAGSATSLSQDQAAAIQEWIKRGGHFVLVMRSGDIDWITNSRFNPLYSIMPQVNIDRIEGVDYEMYRGLLAKPRSTAFLPSNNSVHIFTPVENLSRKTDAIRLITGDGGECVVATRLVGTGAVTLVGLNLTNTEFVRAGIPHIEAFWNRVLGRRDRLFTKDEYENSSMRFQQRNTAVYDRQIADRIDAKGAATQGVMLGFVVFLAYWLVAAPASFYMLKKVNLLKHAWLAFVGATIIFTGISWGGVALIKPRSGHNRHVTFLEHVYGPSVQRTRTFLSVLVPEYGEATISVGNPIDDGGERFTNTLAPLGDLGAAGSFPDSRAYLIDSVDPSKTTFPVRSTIKNFRVDWAGSTEWRMIRPIGGGSNVQTEPGEILVTPQAPPRDGVHILEGVLEHNLPAALDNVIIIVTRGQRYYQNASDLFSFASEPYEFSLGSPWEPGIPLDLELMTATPDLGGVRRIEKWLGNHRNDSWDNAGSPIRALLAAGLINVMPPPNTRDNKVVTPLRSVIHGWDLGRWFTQPCVIIMGTVEDAQCPTPIQVNGRTFRSSGLTVVRWIYPLPENPVQIVAPEEEPTTSPIGPSGGNG